MWWIANGDSREVLRAMADASVDSVVCDPPYELSNSGEASAARVAAKVLLPKNPKIEPRLSGDCQFRFLMGEIAKLGSVCIDECPSPSVPVVPVALDDDSAGGDDDIEYGNEGSGSVIANEDASIQNEAESAEYLGAFALKCADAEALVHALARAGASFDSGRFRVGPWVPTTRGPRACHCRRSVVLRDADIRAINDPHAHGVGAFTRTEHEPVFAFVGMRGTTQEYLSAFGALAFLRILQTSGAQLVRASPAASGLSPMLEPSRVRYVVRSAHGALAFDIAIHEFNIQSNGFMGKAWDGSKIAYDVGLWAEVLRVLKPGGHLLAFGGTRTYHRMACAIEDAGFEVRDSIHWIYGSGFPKSLDVSNAIDKAAGAEREVVRPVAIPRGRRDGTIDLRGGWQDVPMVTAPATDAAHQWAGWGTALKPAHEPVVVARKPIHGTVAANVLAHGTGAINVDGCRVKGEGRPQQSVNDAGRWPPNILLSHAPDCGDECAEGCAVAEMDGQSGTLKSGNRKAGEYETQGYMGAKANPMPSIVGDTGGASRFFPVFRYQAKASRADRDAGLEAFPIRIARSALNTKNGQAERMDGAPSAIRANTHPTVKPTELMRWLVRLVTPPGGLVLDPFTGSGSTGVAAVAEGFRFAGVELSPEYAEIARARVAHSEATRTTTLPGLGVV